MLPVSGGSSPTSAHARHAPTTSSSLPGYRRYIVALPTPARAATPSTVSPSYPASANSSIAASRIASSASALRGLPGARRASTVGAVMSRSTAGVELAGLFAARGTVVRRLSCAATSSARARAGSQMAATIAPMQRRRAGDDDAGLHPVDERLVGGACELRRERGRLRSDPVGVAERGAQRLLDRVRRAGVDRLAGEELGHLRPVDRREHAPDDRDAERAADLARRVVHRRADAGLARAAGSP